MQRCLAMVAVLVMLGTQASCGRSGRVDPEPAARGDAPLVRVRVVAGSRLLSVAAGEGLIAIDSAGRQHAAPSSVAVRRIWKRWTLGDLQFNDGTLTLKASRGGPLSVTDASGATGSYRGSIVLVPQAVTADNPDDTRFDAVNHLDIDSYLMGVVPREMPPDFHLNAFKAQAVVARTYALWEVQRLTTRRHFDVFADDRSQVYGGFAAETTKTRQAVQATAGLVIAAGPDGQEKIFKAYFSSTCGGVTQSNADAFRETFQPVFEEQFVGPLCSSSPRYRWGPVVIPKAELTRRMKLWAARRGHDARNMGELKLLHVEKNNKFNRPVRFRAVDAAGRAFTFSGEALRWAVNEDAGPGGGTLLSSFVTLVDEPASVRFTEGRGWGHAVGMCQWCAQERARRGMDYRQIVTLAYPGAKLIRAY